MKHFLFVLTLVSFVGFTSCHSTKNAATDAVTDAAKELPSSMSPDAMKSYFLDSPEVQTQLQDQLINSDSGLRNKAVNFLKKNPDTQTMVTDFITKNPDAKGKLMQYVFDNPDLSSKLMDWVSGNPKILKQAMTLLGM
jgi:hypothetical protein